MADVKSERRQALEVALASIDRQFGKGAIMRLGQGGRAGRDRGDPDRLARARRRARHRRIPRGRVTEIYGPESSGKTTLALHVIAEAQRAGGIAAFIDAEHALDPIYAKKLGREYRRAPDLAARYGRAGAGDRGDARSLQRRRRHRGRLGGGPGAARGARRRHGRLAPGPAGAADVTGPAKAHRRHLPLGRQRDLHQPDPREDRRHVRVSSIGELESRLPTARASGSVPSFGAACPSRCSRTMPRRAASSRGAS